MEADDEFQEEIDRFRAELHRLRTRLEHVETQTGIKPAKFPDEGVDDAENADAEPASLRSAPAIDIKTQKPAEASSTSRSRRKIGAPAKWFGWIGILELVIGIAFLIRYAIVADYLGYGARVLLAVGTGVGLLGIGRIVGRQDRYWTWAQTVTGGGLAIVYFAIFAAYSLEGYREAIGIPLGATIALLTLVVGLGVGIAYFDNSRLVALEAFLFGFITVTLGFEFGTIVLGFALGLAIGIATVSILKPWIELAVGGAIGTYLVYLVWFDRTTDPLIPGALYLLVAFVLFLSVLYLSDREVDAPWRLSPIIWGYNFPTLLVFNAFAFAVFFDVLLQDVAPWGRTGLFLALAGCFAVGSIPRVQKIGRPSPYLGVFFLLIAIVLGVPTVWVTILWIVLVVALVAIAGETGLNDLRYASYAVSAFVLGKLLTVDANELPAGSLDTPFAAARPWPFIAAIVGFSVISYLFVHRGRWLTERERSGRLTVPVVYAWLATALAVFLVGFELDGVLVSLAWALFGLGLLMGAIRTNWTPLRHQSVAVLTLTAGKVFLFDTADLDPLARTVSFLALGVMLLVAAFVYTR